MRYKSRVQESHCNPCTQARSKDQSEQLLAVHHQMLVVIVGIHLPRVTLTAHERQTLQTTAQITVDILVLFNRIQLLLLPLPTASDASPP